MPFHPDQLMLKFQNLEDNQDSIGSTANWLLGQKESSQEIADTWATYMLSPATTSKRRLMALYVANHAVQQELRSIVNGPFQHSFGLILPRVLGQVIPQEKDPKLNSRLRRVLTVWQSRAVFPPTVLKSIEESVASASPVSNGDTTNNNTSTKYNQKAPVTGHSEIPAPLQVLLVPFREVARHGPASNALKISFDEAIGALDPSATDIVYQQNYHTVKRLGHTTQDSLKKTIIQREIIVEKLRDLLIQQEELLSLDRQIQNEIDNALETTDPAFKDNQNSFSNNMLPTYDESQSDSDSDEDDDDDDKKKDTKQKEKETVIDASVATYTRDDTNPVSISNEQSINAATGETENQNVTGLKRSIEEEKEENGGSVSPSKKAKIQEISTEEQPEEQPPSDTVTSSIQDLLSKLAN
ncbi:hypothetical protein TBLA_0C03260 [Henningerozyma blattae CBS 6284]|uniref:CID domain-containing protein n=1 Tax=Henningerozyma blattae (strain ATCC 34711 / CBS 6284 / DSM 70876 / NBRC 10599 / NRRL Y-10934 / UCD 77-7) TaxID=1071380 RepID=I2H178_HENB6|nr:hypothetical protein TBLA_0C03260 [Tetrapisispora blattae CBS 6284]CCH60130.1 hypothetical protein TBLA_0C03260 [Tetrapisispora blattae CBS 6284]